MFLNQLKTLILLSALSGLFLLLGHWLGGSSGLVVAFIIAIMMNLFTYFLSDKMVLAMYGAQPLDPDKYKNIYRMVDEMCQEARMPMPKLWLIPSAMSNAFATGRNPEHSSVAVTEGIIEILEEHELRGVIAHELSHIKNRDILIATIAATVAMAISYLAHMMQWAFIFGGREERERGGGMGALLVAIIMPIAATLIQLAISRSREYLADETGAHISHDPLALASALEKLTLDTKIHETRPETPVQASTASLFIVYPFSGGGWLSLFSTHPPMEKRIERLKALATKYY